MSDTSIFPYYYPTTAVFIDDSSTFLDALELQLPPRLAFKLFQSPERALTAVNAKRGTPLYRRCISQYRGDDENQSRLIHLDLAQIEMEISNTARFSEIAVVAVDYDMPGLNGVEFCKRIENPRIKKILFTGVADEKVAVKAFNEGVIDRFIMKNEPEAMETINRTVFELQSAYFNTISALITNYLSLDMPRFMVDEGFQHLFRDLCEERGFVEYYLVEQPRGFLFLTDAGELFRMVVYSEEDLDRQIKFVEKNGASKSVVDELRNRRQIPYIYDYLDEPDLIDWDDYLVPAMELKGDQSWFYALVHNPPVDIEFDADASTYQSYLRTLDAS